MPAHALAGFFRELVALKHPGVEDLMKQWGLYYRQLRPRRKARAQRSRRTGTGLDTRPGSVPI